MGRPNPTPPSPSLSSNPSPHSPVITSLDKPLSPPSLCSAIPPLIPKFIPKGMWPALPERVMQEIRVPVWYNVMLLGRYGATTEGWKCGYWKEGEGPRIYLKNIDLLNFPQRIWQFDRPTYRIGAELKSWVRASSWNSWSLSFCTLGC